MSKYSPEPFKLNGYPTFRLYSEPKKFVEFKEKELNEKTFRKWLKDEKVEGIEEVKEPEKTPETPKKKEAGSSAPVVPPPDAPVEQPTNEKERSKAAAKIQKE